MFDFLKRKPRNTLMENFQLKLENHGYKFHTPPNNHGNKLLNELYNLHEKIGFKFTEHLFGENNSNIFIYLDLSHLFGEIFKINPKFDFFTLLEPYTEMNENGDVDYCNHDCGSILKATLALMKLSISPEPLMKKKYNKYQLSFIVECLKNDWEYDGYVDKITDSIYSYQDIIELRKLSINPKAIKSSSTTELLRIVSLKNYKHFLSKDDLLQIPKFDDSQLYEIKNGIESNINVKCYFDPNISSEIMKKVRIELEKKYIDELVNRCNGDKND